MRRGDGGGNAVVRDDVSQLWVCFLYIVVVACGGCGGEGDEQAGVG